jgi:aldehyde dehydrogenase (NAD+)
MSASAETLASPRLDEFHACIAGEWRGASGGATFDDVNPADTREVVGRFPACDARDAAAAIEAARAAFEGWKRTPITKRARILAAAADALEAGTERFARELTREEGKPLALAREEFLRSAQTLRFYATEAQTLAGETYPQDDPDLLVYSVREPLGVVVAIAPWNFPVSIPARKIAPALATGNTVVFKPASDAPLSGLRLAQALIEAGLPPGVLNFVTGSASALGPTLTRSPIVRAITFTGSTRAGEEIHRNAPFTTRLQMELGGKNPLVVMEDADLEKAVDLAVKGGLSLTGQACTGTSRIIVVAEVRERFTARLLEKVRALRTGNGLVPGVDLGPLATRSQLDTVLAYVDIGRGEARLLAGGERLRGEGYDHGYFVTPAVFDRVEPHMRIAREEIFGPVLAVMEASGYADAIAKANDCEYGLAAAIATRNPRYMHDFANDIQAGSVKVNRTTTGNLVNAPFGGMKRSSTSTFRESGRVGLDFFTQTKTIYRGC